MVWGNARRHTPLRKAQIELLVPPYLNVITFYTKMTGRKIVPHTFIYITVYKHHGFGGMLSQKSLRLRTVITHPATRLLQFSMRAEL